MLSLRFWVCSLSSLLVATACTGKRSDPPDSDPASPGVTVGSTGGSSSSSGSGGDGGTSSSGGGTGGTSSSGGGGAGGNP